MNISITGNLGSGKSTVCRILKQKGYDVISSGTLFREYAKERNMDVNELTELAKKDTTIDDIIDKRNKELGEKVDNTIFDSRLSWFFIPDSFKVFIMVDIDVAAKRIYEDNRITEKYKSYEDCKEHLKIRSKEEQNRFKKLYNVDYYDMSNYDLVIDSTNKTPEDIAQIIMIKVKLFR